MINLKREVSTLKRGILLFFITALFLTGCGVKQENEITKDQLNSEVTVTPTNKLTSDILVDEDNNQATTIQKTAVTAESDGSISFDLSDTKSILIKSISGSKGITLTNSAQVKDITNSLSICTPYNLKDDYKKPYDYSLTFYDATGAELTTIQAFDNFIISYDGKVYYDKVEQFYLWNVRKPYIEESKKSFTSDDTTFRVNGKVYNIQDVDISINAITKFSWLGYEDMPEPTLVLDCHINPQVGYCTVFDVEKMDYIFGAYGTSFTFEDYSAKSLIYAFQDSVYNYWGDSLYHNEDNSSYIYSLEYSKDTSNGVLITLSNRDKEELTEVTRINYYGTGEDSSIYYPNSRSDFEPLSRFQADLTHDGNNETLSISKIDAAGDLAMLEISDTEGNNLWTDYAHTSHVGWNSVYLCRMKDEDYLLVFNPYQCTGSANFTYELFYLTGLNTIEIVDSSFYSFNYGAKEGTENAFDEKTFRTFADKVTTYLQNSYLLMSTENGELKVSTEENHLPYSDQYEADKWISVIKSEFY